MIQIEQVFHSIDNLFGSYYSFNNQSFKVVSNNLEINQKLDDYFHEWKAEGTDKNCIEVRVLDGELPVGDLTFLDYREVGKKRIKEQFADIGDYRIIKKVKTGVHFAVGAGANYAFGPVKDYTNQLINFMNALFMEVEMRQNAFLFHAAGVAKNGTGIILAAQSGKGKSTTAMHLMNTGIDFISNDRVVLQKKGSDYTMVGVPKHPRINPGTLLNNSKLKHLLQNPERFDGLSTEEIWNWEEKYDAIIPEIYGEGKFHLSAKSVGLVIIDWGEDDHALQISQIDLNDYLHLMPAIMKTPSLMTPKLHAERMHDSEAEYIAFLKDLPVYRLSGNIDAEKGVELIGELLG